MKLRPGQVLCVNRKFTNEIAKPRQSAFVERFAQGCGGKVVSKEQAEASDVSHPFGVRGMKFTALVDLAWKQNRTFYYIDNGYFGNRGRKIWFRIIKNHVHDLREPLPRDGSRLSLCEVMTKPRSHGRTILLAPPSVKSFSLWNIDQTDWINSTVAQLRSHTDRPIRIRLKRTREDRMAENTIEQDLANDVHCLVTYNSVAAVEAIMLGKPAICLGPNAAGVVSSHSLSAVDDPYFPDEDKRQAWLRHLSYSQFTFTEMSDGTAWRILNQS